MTMFGRLTRETAEWVPARLLCVRFNVKNPFADDKEAAGSKKKKPPSFDSAELFSKLDEQKPTTGKSDDSAESGAGDKKPLPLALAAETKADEEVVQEKPPMDLFKAIFANSDSESSEDEDDSGRQQVVGEKEEEKEKPPEKAEKERGSKPKETEAPRGIFANIDFDALNRRRRPKTPPPLVKEKVATTKPKSVLDQSVRTLLGIKNPR